MRAVKAITCALTVLLLSAVTTQAAEVVKVYVKKRHQTVYIRQGSGIYLGRGLVLTASHVLEGYDDYRIGYGNMTYRVDIRVATAKKFDKTWLDAPGLKKSGIKPAVLSKSTPGALVGRKVRISGFPTTLGHRMIEGEIAETGKADEFRRGEVIRYKIGVLSDVSYWPDEVIDHEGRQDRYKFSGMSGGAVDLFDGSTIAVIIGEVGGAPDDEFRRYILAYPVRLE